MSLKDAIWMHTHRMGDLGGIEDSEDLLWKSPEGTHLYWLSPFSMGDGYATAAENLVHALKGQGCQIEIHQCWFVSLEGLRPETVEMLQRPVRRVHRVGLCMATPGEFRKLPTPYRIGLTMYESDDPLRNMPEWKHHCHDVDLLVVPCEWCKGVFEQFVKIPVKVAPLAVNPFYFVGKKRRAKETFTFVTYGTLSGRKAPLEMLDAFKKAFPRKKYPDARIVFKTRLGYFGWGENQLPDPDPDSRVSIISGDWFPQEMLDWLLQVDAFVFPSKGEGFGMPPREAIATGLPTILANHTGLVTACDDRYTWPLPTGKVEDSPLGGTWSLPDWDYLIDVMRWMYHNREAAYQQGYEASQWFAREHSPEVIGRKLLDIIEGVDPKESTKRHNRVERASLEKPSDHLAFFNWVGDLVPPPGPIWDMGVGEGTLCQGLIRRGYEVVGVVSSEHAREAREKLAMKGVHPKLVVCDNGTPNIQRLRREGISLPAACVSMGVLQQLGNRQIVQNLQNWLAITPMVLFSVPSVYYLGHYAEGARLMRQAQWHDILESMSCVLKKYGQGGQYFRGQASRLVVTRMATRRRGGRILQGVWHANH